MTETQSFVQQHEPAPSEEEIRFSLPDVGPEEIAAVTNVLQHGWITTGNECVQLEMELAEYLEIEHVVAVSSCTAALEITAAALRLPEGSRIGIPTWTFLSTALAPIHQGLHPVFVDIDADDFNVSPEALERSISRDGLDAVIGVHFAGSPFADEIHDLCTAAGIPIIEDAAHALGARDRRGPIGGKQTAGCCLSFYATKNLTSAEGGAIATDDPDLAAFARSFRLHGMSKDAWARYLPGAKQTGYDLVGPGLKANLPDVLAAMARAQLSRFDAMQARRSEIVQRYRENLATMNIDVVPRSLPSGFAHHLMMVLLPEGIDRQAVQDSMLEHRVGTSVHFRPLHRFAWFAEHGFTVADGGTPTADSAESRALSLPLHTRLSDEQVDRVCTVLSEVLGSQ